jgi:DNA-binding NarL/FixJ family response regulator
MPAAQREQRVDYGQIEDLLAMVLAARGGRFERRVLASTLKVLADWLALQARMLSEDDEDEAGMRGGLGLRVLPHGADVARLTRREREIVSRIARGYSNRQIADDLVIATSTTERHVANILGKLGFQSRTQVAAWAIENGL